MCTIVHNQNKKTSNEDSEQICFAQIAFSVFLSPQFRQLLKADSSIFFIVFFLQKLQIEMSVLEIYRQNNNIMKIRIAPEIKKTLHND